jgi:hypothetical protein
VRKTFSGWEVTGKLVKKLIASDGFGNPKPPLGAVNF